MTGTYHRQLSVKGTHALTLDESGMASIKRRLYVVVSMAWNVSCLEAPVAKGVVEEADLRLPNVLGLLAAKSNAGGHRCGYNN